MKRFLLFIAFVFGIFFQNHAQRLDYDNTSKTFLGFNIGHTWHTSDVDNIKGRFPIGAGVIVGRSFNYDYGKVISFDLRGRYLGGRWYGHDRDTTSFFDGSPTLQNMYDTVGFGVKNFRSTQHSLDLELAVHYNQLRERTGIDPYIFAGIGLVGTNTKGAFVTETDVDVKSLKYQTPLDRGDDGEMYSKFGLHGKILPSLGVGIGYYFNSSISLGLEHRSTFFRGDYFDGTTIKSNGEPSKIKNDIYHYTSFYLKWYLKPIKKKEPPVRPNDPIHPDQTIVDPVRTPPVVNFTNPSRSGTTVTNPHYTILANVQHVLNANDLTFTQNGGKITSFIFNPGKNRFESNVTLQEGQNVFTLTGVNLDGSDSDQTIIIYKEEERIYPPVVNIVDPASSPHTVNQLNYIIRASIQNISSKNQLTVNFNNKPFTAYSFQPTGSVNFTANVNLQPGVNTFRITGINEAGTDFDETVIIYTRQPAEDTGYPPVVTIVTPSTNPYTTSQPTEQVVATVANITSKSQVQVRINGVGTNNFTYNNSTKLVQFTAPLNNGNNIVSVRATNDFGYDVAETNIYYRQPVQNYPPTVDIITPANDPHTTTNASENIVANTTNITSKSQVEVRINGVSTNNFTFNTSTGLVQFNANLVSGNNSVLIVVTNQDGTDNDSRTIFYRKPVQNNPPSIYITTPAANPHISAVNTANIVATTQNITSKNQIEVKVNGNYTNNFTFNSTLNRIQLTANLVNGSNNVTIKVTNQDGTDSDDRTINYRQPTTPKNPPTVTITTPAGNPHTSNANTVNIVATTTNITSKNQVEVKVNGAVTSNFTFTPLLNRVQLTANLVAGNNSVVIKVANQDGTDSDDRTITYRKPAEVKNPPTVTITTPSGSPHHTEIGTQVVIAKTTNISSKSQIEVKINGINTDNFTFNSLLNTVQFTANLDEGNNSVYIKVTNQDGTANQGRTIVYKKKEAPKTPPTVTITTPADNPTTSSVNTAVIVAKTTNISNKNQVEVRVNGASTTNFTFNALLSSIQLTTNLVSGNNTVNIKVTNQDGTASDERTIFYRQPMNPPTVKITTPASSPTLVRKDKEKIVATTTNVTSKEQIKVFVNNASFTGFTFNAGTQRINFDATLQTGSNNVRIEVSNSGGSDQDQVVINKIPKFGGEVDGTINNPCTTQDYPTFTYLAPQSKVTTHEFPDFKIIGKTTNISNRNQITVYFNGVKRTDFIYNQSTNTLEHSLVLVEGKNIYKVVLENDCKKEEFQIEMTYTPIDCNIEVALGANDEFCLITPNGTLTKDDLLTSTFVYNGPASGLYFKANNNLGRAMANNVAFFTEKDNYYHFFGNLTVELKKVNNKWVVCVTSLRTPFYGKGKNKPASPCAAPAKTEKDNKDTKKSPTKVSPKGTEAPKEEGRRGTRTISPTQTTVSPRRR